MQKIINEWGVGAKILVGIGHNGVLKILNVIKEYLHNVYQVDITKLLQDTLYNTNLNVV